MKIDQRLNELADLLKTQPVSSNRKALEPVLEPIRATIRSYTDAIWKLESVQSFLSESHEERSRLIKELDELETRIDTIRQQIWDIDKSIQETDAARDIQIQIKELQEQKKAWQNKYSCFMPNEIGEYPFEKTDLFALVVEWELKVFNLLQEIYPCGDFDQMFQAALASTQPKRKYIGGGEYEDIEGTHFINAVHKYISLMKASKPTQ